ncbi:MAG: HD domain-containing phosphohydrolase [Planctomycetota bacterium]
MSQKILVVDDEPAIRQMLRAFLIRLDYQVRDAGTGIDAIELLAREPASLVLCDIQMPGMDGLDTLSAIKKNHPDLPVVMMSGFTTHDRLIEALDKGAADFIAKPINLTQAKKVITKILNPRLRKRPEYSSTIASVLRESYRGLLQITVQLLENKNSYLKEHSRRVAENAARLAEALKLPAGTVEVINCAALLHDIGKISVPDAVLLREGKLTPEDWAEMKKHPATGSDMVEQLKLFRGEEPLIRHHHEHYDGSGYPDGLAGENIPIGARIISIADAYDAIISSRPYRRPVASDRALDIISQSAGTQFDPKLTAEFLNVIKSGGAY